MHLKNYKRENIRCARIVRLVGRVLIVSFQGAAKEIATARLREQRGSAPGVKKNTSKSLDNSKPNKNENKPSIFQILNLISAENEAKPSPKAKQRIENVLVCISKINW